MKYSSGALNDKWLKASVLGTTWAASEILIGSFLHNVKFPFSGNILTGIALILLISVNYRWKENGLFWRAGLITAILKTTSPSAVIFGPMIAIFTEALLLEIAVRILGKNVLGYLVGAALAMSWVLVQRVVNLIIFYGAGIVDIYTHLMQMAEKQLAITTDLVWLPIFVLLAIHLLSGIWAAVIGMRAGKRLTGSSLRTISFDTTEQLPSYGGPFEFSRVRLVLNIFLLVGGLLSFSLAPWYVWVPLTLLIVWSWIHHYRSAMRQLSKPKFWIWFVLITLLAALILGSVQSGGGGWKGGLMAGIQMNFRAALIILGFSAIGKELYNPAIVNYFKQSRFRQLHQALELSFRSVGSVLQILPSARTYLKSPFEVVQVLMEHADRLLYTYRQQHQQRIFMLIGDKAEGKTSFLTELVEECKAHTVKPAGFLSLRTMQGEETRGYYLLNLASGSKHPLLQTEVIEGSEAVGRFYFHPEGLSVGKKLLSDFETKSDVFIVDEVGMAEVEGKAWSEGLQGILRSYPGPIILSVRRLFAEPVIAQFDLSAVKVWDVALTNPKEAFKQLFPLASKEDV